MAKEELMTLDVVSINVLGTHVHPAGQWMIGYEYMFDNMDGNRDGTRRVSDSRVLDAYNASPTDMTMQTNMLTLMYSPTNNLTLMGMLPYITKSMNHVMRDGTRFGERSHESINFAGAAGAAIVVGAGLGLQRRARTRAAAGV